MFEYLPAFHDYLGAWTLFVRPKRYEDPYSTSTFPPRLKFYNVRTHIMQGQLKAKELSTATITTVSSFVYLPITCCTVVEPNDSSLSSTPTINESILMGTRTIQAFHSSSYCLLWWFWWEPLRMPPSTLTTLTSITPFWFVLLPSIFQYSFLCITMELFHLNLQVLSNCLVLIRLTPALFLFEYYVIEIPLAPNDHACISRPRPNTHPFISKSMIIRCAARANEYQAHFSPDG